MAGPFTILNVNGPYREPREAAFSYDYSVQRPNWPSANGVRVKVAIAEELDYLKCAILGVSGGSPGQQLRLTQILTRRIADRKLQIADDQGMLTERADVMIAPFTGALVNLFPLLDAWMKASQASLRREVQETIGI